MRAHPLAAALRTAFVLLAFAVAATALLAFTFQLTRSRISAAEEQAKLALLNQVIPTCLHDNDLLNDRIELAPDALLGTQEPVMAYRAYLKGRPTAVAFEAVAPDGYGGKIKLLIAVLADGTVAGVRVISHHETPGLGDYIERAKSAWITEFDGKALDPDAASQWRVRKDGGQFDYVAGATITPRAVVKAVRNALRYYADNRDRLLSAPARNDEHG